MPHFVERVLNGRQFYDVLDENGHVVESYRIEDGPERAILATMPARAPGKMHFPVPVNGLPDGYYVVLVIDGDQTYFLVAAPGVGFLPGPHPSITEAIRAAWRDFEAREEPNEPAPRPGM